MNEEMTPSHIYLSTIFFGLFLGIMKGNRICTLVHRSSALAVPEVFLLAAEPTASVKGYVTPSVLHRKSFTKIYHEHHVYVLMHVIECLDKFLVTENDQ